MAYTTIDNPVIYFNTVLYTGNGSAGHAITGVGHQPDWVWMKGRNQAFDQCLYDAVRGVTKLIRTNTTNAEVTQSGVTAFGADGFTLGSSGETNSNNDTYASWNWKANGSGSSNTDGSINTSYTSASTASGFSISTYTGNGNIGATVGHGLGAVPEMIVVKRLNSSGGDWMVYHQAIGNDHRLRFNTTAAKQDNPVWNDTTPTSAVYYMNDNGDANASGGTYVAYCFTPKKGFSKFGFYMGNGNAKNFVFTGFRPAYVMLKIVSSTDSWNIYDNKRNGYNGTGGRLRGESSAVEDQGTAYQTCDFYANGFAPQGTDATSNGSGQTYVYMAFAESPFVNSSGIPGNARV